jgi:hypothetical protein
MWVDADESLPEGRQRLKWPDGYIGQEIVAAFQGQPCIQQSHRGVLFYGPVPGAGFQIEVEDPPADVGGGGGEELPPGVEPPPPGVSPPPLPPQGLPTDGDPNAGQVVEAEQVTLLK